MSRFSLQSWTTSWLLLLALETIWAAADIAEPLTADLPGEMSSKQGDVSYQPKDKPETVARDRQKLDFGDALRTHSLARASVVLTNGVDLYMSELTRLTIVGSLDTTTATSPVINIGSGRVRGISRGAPATLRVRSPHLAGVNRGTEFLLEVGEDQSVFSVFAGEVELTNARTLKPVRVRNGEQGIAARDQPIRVARLEAKSLVQWWLYYPGVLDPDEVKLAPEEVAGFKDSLAAYRTGDLRAALEKSPGYPELAAVRSDDAKAYLSGILLAIGAVQRAEDQLLGANPAASSVRALRGMMYAVIGATSAETNPPQSSSEWLARSYRYQSAHDLERALRAARLAVMRSPNFAFGWARVADLEFSFGHTRDAREAVDRALALSPRNAQAHAVRGFLLAAENRTGEALASFNEAILIDPALGNAWLGRALCKRRLSCFGGSRTNGEAAWLSDLRTAALLEPDRSLLRSYAGKAFADVGDFIRAEKELGYAQKLDPDDPTPWLYSALLSRQQNEINTAVGELDQSIRLNDNRGVYRSRFLLDQDRAVRSASLANIYQAAGMNEVAFREASRAVSYDYANYSAQLFLAQSFDALRDPTRFNLRYETPWFNELLLANMLSPVGGAPLSQSISQQEYTRLFEYNRLGLSADTQIRSDGQLRAVVAQFGLYNNTAYSLDLDYQRNTGVRPNNDLERIEWYATIKHQITAQDTILLLTKYQDYHSGDNFQYYNPKSQLRTNFTFDEVQQPIILAGYHREWTPGIHTLFLGGRLVNDQRFRDSGEGVNAGNFLILETNGAGRVVDLFSIGMDVNYRSELEIYTAELNQIFQGVRNTLVFGSRAQKGTFTTENLLTLPLPFAGLSNLFLIPPASARLEEGFERFSVYAYDHWKIFDPLVLTAGISYDYLTFPENFRQAPISSGVSHRNRVSPKAAFVYAPFSWATLRGAYARSQGGVSLDESYRLEPVQLAGFSQGFRTIIPESIVGSVSAPSFETIGGALDLAFASRTYVGVVGERLTSKVRRTLGAFSFTGDFSAPRSTLPFSTPQHLEFEENSVSATVNQLLGHYWSMGAQYRFTRDELELNLPKIPVALNPGARSRSRSDLQQTSFFAAFNHPVGWFARGESHWYRQDNSALRSDFFQHNIFVGFRFPRLRGELVVGILNLGDTDYRLNPLNVYAELPRERVFLTRLKLNF